MDDSSTPPVDNKACIPCANNPPIVYQGILDRWLKNSDLISGMATLPSDNFERLTCVAMCLIEYT